MSGHTGRPVVKTTDYGRVLVLCAMGHLVQSVSLADWPGSLVEAQCGDPEFKVTCDGRAES